MSFFEFVAKQYPNIIGFIGVGLCISAYFFVQSGRWRGDEAAYSIINLLGSVMILFSLFYYWNFASFLIEVCWIVISLLGLWRWYSAQ